ncbi:MAG: hypothetical protein WBV94_21805 [Blastocatellia bacterium]
MPDGVFTFVPDDCVVVKKERAADIAYIESHLAYLFGLDAGSTREMFDRLRVERFAALYGQRVGRDLIVHGNVAYHLQQNLSLDIELPQCAENAAPTLYPSSRIGKCRGAYSGRLAEIGRFGQQLVAATTTNLIVVNNQMMIMSMDGIAIPSDGKRWIYIWHR